MTNRDPFLAPVIECYDDFINPYAEEVAKLHFKHIDYIGTYQYQEYYILSEVMDNLKYLKNPHYSILPMEYKKIKALEIIFYEFSSRDIFRMPTTQDLTGYVDYRVFVRHHAPDVCFGVARVLEKLGEDLKLTWNKEKSLECQKYDKNKKI